jgi:ATP-dependent Clp protease ATP-binding subunit ClpA
MTSTLGAADAEKLKIGFGKNTKTDTDVAAVKSFFTPEFRNRIDAVIRFNKLDKSVVEKIVKRLQDEINDQLKDKNIEIKLDKTATNYFVTEGYEPTMGARPLKRLFENELKKPLSKKILFEDMKNIEITVKVVDGEVDIETHKQKEV